MGDDPVASYFTPSPPHSIARDDAQAREGETGSHGHRCRLTPVRAGGTALERRSPLVAALVHEALHLQVTQEQLGQVSRHVVLVLCEHDDCLRVAGVALAHGSGEERCIGLSGQPHVELWPVGVLKDWIGGGVGQVHAGHVPPLSSGSLRKGNRAG